MYVPKSKGAIRAGLSISLAAFLAGCHNGGQSTPAVETPGVSHLTDDQLSSHVVGNFPTGEAASSAVSLEVTSLKEVHVNQSATVMLKLTNLTSQTLHNVVLVSTNPSAFSVTNVVGSTTQAAEAGALSYAVGDLAPKETRTIQVAGMTSKAGEIDTCYTVQFSPVKLCTAIAVANPLLGLTVTAPADIDICQPLDYVYTVTNSGSGLARNVMLQEDLPDGLLTVDGQRSVSANLGDIQQGQSRQTTAHLKPSRTGSFTGQAMARSDADAAAPQPTATAVHAPALGVTIAGADSDFVGKTVGYKIAVMNKGDAPARNAVLTLSRNGPGNVMLTGADPTSGAMSLGVINPGETKNFDASAMSNDGGVLTVTATASSDCATAVAQSARTQFNTIPALLLETVDEIDPVRVGDNVVYDVKVTNQGSGPDTNIQVVSTLPAEEQYVGSTGVSAATAQGQTVTFAPITTLGPKESVSWKITAKAMKAADVQFKTTATSDGVKQGAEKTEPTKLY